MTGFDNYLLSDWLLDGIFTTLGGVRDKVSSAKATLSGLVCATAATLSFSASAADFATFGVLDNTTKIRGELALSHSKGSDSLRSEIDASQRRLEALIGSMLNLNTVELAHGPRLLLLDGAIASHESVN